MQGIAFRRATAADLPAIVAMLADDALGATRDDASLPLDDAYLTAFRLIDADPNQLLAVMEKAGEDGKGEVAGCLQLTFIPGLSRKGALRGLIEGVRVSSKARGGGLGRQMIEWAIEQCRARGCVMAQLTSDKSRKDAHRFYEGLGFRASHEGMKLTLRA